MNKNYVLKFLHTLQEYPKLFSLKEKIVLSGFSNSDLEKLKKYAILNNLITIEKQGMLLSEKALKMLAKYKPTKLNIEYFNEEKMPLVLSKAIRNYAKYLFDNEELKENSLEYAIKIEVENIGLNIEDMLFEDNLNDIIKKSKLSKSLLLTLILNHLSKNQDKIIIYEKGEFCIAITSLIFDKMNINPAWYSFKRATIENKLLDDFASVINSKQNIIDFTKKLYSQFKKLHKIVFETNNLSPKTLKFKNTLLNAKDPIILFEKELCVLFKEKKEFQYALSELENYYPKLLDELEKYTLQSFCVNSLDELKTKLAKIKEFISNKELLIFANNLDSIERLATYVNQNRCPKDWNDLDVADYKLKIKNYSNEYSIIQSALEFDESLLDENTKNLIYKVLKLSKAQRALLLRGIVA